MIREGHRARVSMLGLPGSPLRHRVDGTTGRVVVDFPAMSELVRRCGGGCRWGYVLRFQEEKEEGGEKGEEDEEEEERHPFWRKGPRRPYATVELI